MALVVKNQPANAGRHEFHPWVRKIPWRRTWQPAPGFLPGEFHGQRSLEGYSPQRHKEPDVTERLSAQEEHLHVWFDPPNCPRGPSPPRSSQRLRLNFWCLQPARPRLCFCPSPALGLHALCSSVSVFSPHTSLVRPCLFILQPEPDIRLALCFLGCASTSQHHTSHRAEMYSWAHRYS